MGIGRRLAASYEASSAVYKPRVHTAIQETQAESFYADNGFIEFSMLEGLGIKQPEAYVKKALPEGVSLETVHCHPQTVENMDGEEPRPERRSCCAACARSWGAHRSTCPPCPRLLLPLCCALLAASVSDTQHLATCCAPCSDPVVLSAPQGELENAVEEELWVEAAPLLPVQFGEADTLQVLGRCESMAKGELSLLEDSGGVVVAKALLKTCAGKFEAAAAGVIDKAVAAGKLPAAPSGSGGSGGGGGGGGAAADTENWSDEEEERGRGKRSKKKGKSARAAAKEEAAAQSGGKGKRGKKDRGKDKEPAGLGGSGGSAVGSGGGGGGGVDAASLAPSVKAMGKEMREWYKEHDMSVEVSELLAEVLRPALLTAYGEAHRSAFAALSQSRKKKQEVFESALAQVNSHRLLTCLLTESALADVSSHVLSLDRQESDNFAVFLKGCAAMAEPAARTSLEQHLLKEHGADIAAMLLANQAMHSGVAIGGDEAAQDGPLPASLRTLPGRNELLGKLARSNGTAVSESLTSLCDALASREAEDFASLLPAACSACGVRFSALDKKREKQLVFQHRQALLSRLEGEEQPGAAVRVAAQLLACTRLGVVVDVPLKGVSALVAHLVQVQAHSPTNTLMRFDARCSWGCVRSGAGR